MTSSVRPPALADCCGAIASSASSKRPGPPDAGDEPPAMPDDWLLDAVAALEAPSLAPDLSEPRKP